MHSHDNFTMSFVLCLILIIVVFCVSQIYKISKRISACAKLHFTCASVEDAKRFESSITSCLHSYEVIHYNDEQMKLLVSEFGSKVMTAFDCVKPFAFKADIFRLCALIKYGGLYLDADIRPRKEKINSFINFEKEYIFVRENRKITDVIPYLKKPFYKVALWQAFLYCKRPGSSVITGILHNIVDRVLTPNLEEINSFDHSQTLVTLYFTGPIAVGEFGLKEFGIPDWYSTSRLYKVQMFDFDGKNIHTHKHISILGKDNTAEKLSKPTHYHNMFLSKGVQGLTCKNIMT